LFHFLFCFSDVPCSGANAGLDIFRLSHYVNQVFLVFLKVESTGLSGEPGDDDCTLRPGAFPLLCDLKLDSIAGSICDADAVKERSVYCHHSAPKTVEDFCNASAAVAGAMQVHAYAGSATTR
jgi:hypothetical protein